MERTIYLYLLACTECLLVMLTASCSYCLLCAAAEAIQHLPELKYHVLLSAFSFYGAQFGTKVKDICISLDIYCLLVYTPV